MAIWQFSIDFIPRKKLIQRLGQIPKVIDEEILWKENLEEGVDLPNNYESLLNHLGEKEILGWRGNSLNWAIMMTELILQLITPIKIKHLFTVGFILESGTKDLSELFLSLQKFVIVFC